MHLFDQPYYRRIFNVLQIGGLILLLSCQSDPIVLNPPGGYEYQQQNFQLKTAYSIQGEAHTGLSPRLYSGILSIADTITTVSTLIRLLPQVLDTHDVCSADIIEDIKVVLTSTTPIAVLDDTTFIDTLIQLDALEISLVELLSYDLEENAVITGGILSDILSFSSVEILSDSLLNTYYSLKINLFDHDDEIINRWCISHEDMGILVSYSPSDSSYLEFFSSDNSEVSFGPRLSVEYAVEEATNINYNRYSFNMDNAVFWSEEVNDLISGPYYVDDSLSVYWGTFYAMDVSLDDQIILNPPLNYDTITVETGQTDIISEELNIPISLLQINVDLNTDILSESDFTDITFKLINAEAFVSDSDPANDNFNTNPDSTENNLVYDAGEVFNDYGLDDHCPDELESGGNGCVAIEEESAYNKEGTEGNKILDWTDYNGNGKWDGGEGEEWGDWGSDWCPDSLETGEGNTCEDGPPCNCSTEPHLDYDLNEDNIDPVGDDWHEINNPDSTQGNHLWNPGEDYHDWGSDGLPESLMGYLDANGSEGNGNYNIGEPFDDTGSDGLFNIDELGWNENRTEGNNQFDGEGEFNDCGVDNCCDDSETCNWDTENDNYNIDPNKDNWNDCGSDGICDEENPDEDGTEGNENWDENEGTEKNLQLDPEYQVENGVWNEGEGEEWFDWGVDGVHDTLEAFQTSFVISPNLYNNNYIFDLSAGELQVSPNVISDTVSLWISEILKTENSLTIEVSVQSHIPLKGLKFQLHHTPYTRVDTILNMYDPSIIQIGGKKLFEDMTLLPKFEFDPIMLDSTLQIDYANDLYMMLDFENLSLFLSDQEKIIHEYSNLILYTDPTFTEIHDAGMVVYVTHVNSSGEDEILKTITVDSLSDSITIPMGQILRGYQNGSIGTYDGLKLKMGGTLYNYSRIKIYYDSTQSNFNPRLDLMYTE